MIKSSALSIFLIGTILSWSGHSFVHQPAAAFLGSPNDCNNHRFHSRSRNANCVALPNSCTSSTTLMATEITDASTKSVDSSSSPCPPPSVPEGTTSTYFKFQGHDVYTQVTEVNNNNNKKKKPIHVILVHGFGCSTVYWRETIDALTSSTNSDKTIDRPYIVHALDLLGQGKSAKPGRADGVEYSINLWAELIDAYAQETIGGGKKKNEDVDIVLMGNSFGSTITLTVATGDYYYDPTTASSSIAPPPQEPWIRNHLKGICMFNCGIGMNSMNIIKEPQWNPFQRALLSFLFNSLNNVVFANIPVLTYILGSVVTKDLLRNTLSGLYKYSEPPLTAEDRVNDELVDSFYDPAKMDGSVEALSQIYTNDAGKTPYELFQDERYSEAIFSKLPIHLVWGNDDPITPIEGGLGIYYTQMAEDYASASDSTSIPKVSIEMVSAGHIPFDEAPNVCHASMHQWLNKIFDEK